MLIGDAKEIWKTAEKEGYEGKRILAEVRRQIPSPKEVTENVKYKAVLGTPRLT